MRIVLILIACCSSLLAQNFQSTSNPYYWKNKISAKSEYWQQDVDYTIDAYLDEKNEIIRGTEQIMYTNNSPDELDHLFFNLYQNAFIQNSYLSNLQQANGEKITYGKWEAEGKGNEILSIKVDGESVRTEIDGSIMKVFLKKPMKPNSKILIDIAFNTYYSKGGQTRRRMKSFMHQKSRHFNGAHWYPRLAVYDRKFGWCTDQHLNREFYGDFGDYRVSLNMPANFVVEATGVLQNRMEVLPDSLRKKLDISNYWHHKWDTAVTYRIPIKKGDRKTWKYLGENVHDFAWIAGPDYRIDEKRHKNITTVAMVLEPHASGWKNACDFTHKVIDVYSRDFGQYAYPKMVVADCYDGMEYPMLTMDGGSDPGYRGLLAHEVGHNWFYGMVNNNETYRAMLDEGFTQFLTVWALEAIDGKKLYADTPKNPYLKAHFERQEVRGPRAYNSFMMDAMNHEHTEINVHSDGFEGATGQGGGYRNVYNKTATMLFNLQYVLGDTLFQNAMKHYFDRWSFRHPYVEDFRQAIIDYTKVDLNWFFDQWIETDKRIDYKISHPKKLATGVYELKLNRKEDMQMPLDITIEGRSGRKYNFYIPNTWFEKKTNATILPRWIGWDGKLKTEYKTAITLPEDPINAIIDTSNRLADINELNNSSKFPLKIKFDSKTSRPLDRQNYTILWRPDIWYNNFDGIKLGMHTEGSLFGQFRKMNLDFWVNTGIGKWAVRDQNEIALGARPSDLNDPISLRFSYETPSPKLLPNSRIKMDLRHLDGIALGSFHFGLAKGNYSEYGISIKSMLRYRDASAYYDYYNAFQWNTRQFMNNSIQIEWNNNQPFKHALSQSTSIRARTSIFSIADYSYAEVEHKELLRLHKLGIKWRFIGRLGINNDNAIATESLLNAGGASGEQLIENEFTRSTTFFPQSFNSHTNTSVVSTYSNLHYGGGLNLRGYSFMPIVSDGNGTLYQIAAQNSGASLNTQINFEHYSPIKLRKLAQTIGLNIYLFGDAGAITNFSANNFQMNRTPFLIDGGVGVSLTMRKFGFLSGIRPLTFRFDIPCYLSHPALGDEAFRFRWTIGIDHAF